MGNGGCPAHQDKIIAEIKEVKTHLSRKIECIEKKLLEPDDGLYARVQKNTNFRKTTRNWLWAITLGLLVSIGKGLYEFAKKVIANA